MFSTGWNLYNMQNAAITTSPTEAPEIEMTGSK
jgi:hypothetical protein